MVDHNNSVAYYKKNVAKTMEEAFPGTTLILVLLLKQ